MVIRGLQLNVRGWRSNASAYVHIFNNVNPEVILLNEHSVLDGERFNIFNYNVYSVNRANERFAGAAVAVRKDLQPSLLDDFYSDVVAVRIRTLTGPVIIATGYVPNRIQYINYIDFNNLFLRDDPVYFIGDLNANHVNFGYVMNNRRGEQVNYFIQSGKCVHLGPDFPTFHNHRSASRPDIVLANTNTYHNFHINQGPPTPSDHVPITFTISHEPIYIPIEPRKAFSRADWGEYKNRLARFNLQFADTPILEEIDEAVDRWTSAIQEVTDETVPTIRTRRIASVKPTHQMRTTGIMIQDLLTDINMNGPTAERHRQLSLARTSLRDQYREKTRELWQEEVRRLDLQSDPQQFWKRVRRLRGNSASQNTAYIKDIDGAKHEEDPQKEAVFRRHWEGIFQDEDPEENSFDYRHIEEVEERITLEHLVPFHWADRARLDQRCPPISRDELMGVIKSTKQRAPGPTGVTAIQLKNLPPNMLTAFLDILNAALSAGYFPDKWKEAIMIFIPKSSGSRHEVKNYRPISLLDVPGKILDKILNERFNAHLRREGLINSRQHGFQNNRGTHTALTLLHENIAQKLPMNYYTDIIFRDVSKAFDRVWHVGLKFKLQEARLHTCYSRILADFLTDRRARIRMGAFVGPAFPLECGVPQGACLSPSLYSFYIHDMPPPIELSDYYCFADDITQVVSVPYKSADMVARTAGIAIEQINEFENKWKICTNQEKFHVIPIARKKTHEIYANDDLIEYTGHDKALGLVLTRTGLCQHVRGKVANAKKISQNFTDSKT